jgi:hypothetical protein
MPITQCWGQDGSVDKELSYRLDIKVFIFSISLLLDACTFMSKVYSWWHIKLINLLNLLLSLRIRGLFLHFPMLFEDMDITTGTTAAAFNLNFNFTFTVYCMLHIRSFVQSECS